VTVAARPETEAGFQEAVLELATLLGWSHVHFRPARTKHGWRTAFSGRPGWPDLVLCRPPRLLFVELKSDARGAKPSAAQEEWLAELDACGDENVAAYLWRPSAWDEIEAALR
jgi:hypothetical protein